MAKIRYDGVIEAIRTTPDGQLEMARAYEKRGAVFSDRILLTRVDLIERLKNGQKIMIGQRLPNLGSTFETTAQVQLISDPDGDLLSTSSADADGQDNLPDIPKF
jgi:hypothetical protein